MTPRQRRVRLNTAHVGMGVLFVTWLVFQVLLGRDHAPPVLDLMLGSIGGVWFGMVVREQGRRDQEVSERVTDAQSTADNANRKVDQLAQETGHSSAGETGGSDGSAG